MLKKLSLITHKSNKDLQKSNLIRWLLYLLNVIVICCVIYVITKTTSTYIKFFSLPTSEIISSIADDEFYVLQVAKNYAIGNGVSFDGKALTTGFHPIYFILLTLIYPFTNSDIVYFLMSSIILKTIFYLLSAFLIFIVTHRLSSNLLYRNQLSAIMSLMFLAHPYSLFLIFSGLEQLISIFFFLCFLFYFIYISTNNKTVKDRSFILWGILLGLAYLARTDNIILLPLLLFFILFSRSNQLSSKIKNVALGAAGYLFIVIPWYVFIYLKTGSLAQNSGAVKIFLNENVNLALNERLFGAFAFVNKFWWPFLNHELAPLYKLFLGLFLIIGIYLIIINIPVLKFRKWLKNNLMAIIDKSLFIKINIQVAVICIFYTSVIAITYGFLFGSAREWYYGLSVVTIFFLFVISYNLFFISLKNQILRVFSILTIVLFSIFAFSGMIKDQENHLGKFTNQKEMFTVSKWMKLHLPKTAIVGSWNAGILGFFSERSVVNLDGLINNDILIYLKSNTLYKYMKKREINYIIDYDVMLYWQEKYFGKSLKEISLVQDTTFSGTWQLSDLSVWRITY